MIINRISFSFNIATLALALKVMLCTAAYTLVIAWTRAAQSSHTPTLAAARYFSPPLFLFTSTISSFLLSAATLLLVARRGVSCG